MALFQYSPPLLLLATLLSPLAPFTVNSTTASSNSTDSSSSTRNFSSSSSGSGSGGGGSGGGGGSSRVSSSSIRVDWQKAAHLDGMLFWSCALVLGTYADVMTTYLACVAAVSAILAFTG